MLKAADYPTTTSPTSLRSLRELRVGEPYSHSLSPDIEAAWPLIAQGDFGHGPVGGLDMARGALRIEQQASVAIADQPVFLAPRDRRGHGTDVAPACGAFGGR
jgi:hypothetical protein